MFWNTGVDYRQFYANADPSHKQIVRDMYALAGLNPDVGIPADLDRINAAPRLAGTNESVNYWRARTQTGRIGVPMLHIHGIGDGRTPVSGPTGYEAAVRQSGGTVPHLLYRQAFIGASGHCTFNTAELAAAVATILRRIEAGRWDNLAAPDVMNALGRTFGVGTPRYVQPGPAVLFTPPKVLNRAFFPDSAGPPAP
jgi:hypothetical protein